MAKNQDGVYQEFLKLVSDPEAFESRKKILADMKQDIDQLTAFAAQRRAEAEERIKAAEKVESANNFVKMALDARASELDAKANVLMDLERSRAIHENKVTIQTSADRAALAQLTKQRENEHAVNLADIAAKKQDLVDHESRLNTFHEELKASKADLLQRHSDHDDKVVEQNAREQALVDAEDKMAEDRRVFDAELARRRAEFEKELDDHQVRLAEIKSLIGSLTKTIS